MVSAGRSVKIKRMRSKRVAFRPQVTDGERIGLIAGNGRFPIISCRSAPTFLCSYLLRQISGTGNSIIQAMIRVDSAGRTWQDLDRTLTRPLIFHRAAPECRRRPRDGRHAQFGRQRILSPRRRNGAHLLVVGSHRHRDPARRPMWCSRRLLTLPLLGRRTFN